jgi:hypothetical protein
MPCRVLYQMWGWHVGHMSRGRIISVFQTYVVEMLWVNDPWENARWGW